MSKGGGDGGTPLKDYYASFAGIAGWGPAHALVAVIVDGKEVWRPRTAVLESTSSNPYSFDITGYGRIHFYWGTDDQTLTDPVLRTRGQPSYRRRILVVFEDFLCGRERETIPDVQCIYQRKPQQTLITGSAADLDSNGQCNPLCAIVERITDPVRGLGKPNSFFKDTVWQTLADSLYTDRFREYLTIDLINAGSARDLIEEINGYLDTYFRTDEDGLLEVGQFLKGSSAPASSATLTEDDLEKGSPLTVDPQPMVKNPSMVELKFINRWRKFEEDTARYESQKVEKLTGSENPDTLERPYIRRASQANKKVAEFGEKESRPLDHVTGTFRAEKVEDINPGDLVTIEKDSTGYSRICRVVRKEADGDGGGGAKLTLEGERLLAPAPGDFDEDVLPDESEFPLQDIEYWHVLQAPHQLADEDPYRLMALVGQDHGTWRGAKVYFQDQATEYDFLGVQSGFAVPVELNEDYSETEDVDDTSGNLKVEQMDPVALGFDRVESSPTEDQISNDEWLFILIQKDDFQQFEVMTLKSIESPTVGVYPLHVLRGRFGTERLSFTSGDLGYFVRRRNLEFFSHGAIDSMAGKSLPADRTASLKVVPFRHDDDLDLSAATAKDLEIEPIIIPDLANLSVTAKTGALQIGWDKTADLFRYRTEIDVSTGASFPVADTITFTVPWDLAPYTVINLDEDIDYYVRIRAVNIWGLKGDYTTHPAGVQALARPSGGPAGEDATLYYIQPVTGTAIHNGQGTLEVVAYRATPTGSEALTSGTIKLYNPLKQEVTEANGYAAGSDSYTGVLDSGDISGSIIISLRDGPDGTPLDTIALIDVADGADAIMGHIEPSGSLASVKQKDGTWAPPSTTLDLDCTFYLKGAAVARVARRITRTDAGSLSHAATTHKHSDGDLNADRVSVDSLGDDTTTLTFGFHYNHDGHDLWVYETVLAVRDGDDAVSGTIEATSPPFFYETVQGSSYVNAGVVVPLGAIDLDVTFSKSGDTLARIARRVTVGQLGDSRGKLTAGVTGHKDGDLNADRVTVTVKGSGQQGIEVIFRYSHADQEAEVAKAITAIPAPSISTPDAPGTPGTPSVSSKTSNSASLSWTAPTTGGPVTQYHIQYATDSSFTNPSTFFSQGTDTSRTVTGLNPSTRYYFRVRAENSGGNSSYSSSVDTTTDAGSVTAPGTPGTPTQTGRTSLSLSLSCAVPSTGTTPTLYRWEYSFNSSFSFPSEVTSTINSVTITSLGSDRTYYVRVRAENSAGNSSYSSALQTSTLPLVSAPLAPNTPTKESGTSSSLSVKTPIITPGTVSTATLYRWQHSTDSSFSNPSEVTSTGRTTTITGLEPETTYYIRVRAENSGGNSSYSGTLTASTDARSFGDWGSSVFGTETSTFDCNTAPDGFSRAAPSASNVPSGATTGGHVYTFADGKQLFIQSPTAGLITVVHYRATKTGSWTTTIPSDLLITDADTQLSSDGVKVIEITASSNTPPTTDSAIELSAEGLIQVVGNTQTYYGYVTNKWTRTIS